MQHEELYRFVIIAMEAMDQLLMACHAPALNLFVESFLKMVQKLLESTEPQLQILATQSVNMQVYQGIKLLMFMF